MRHRISKALLSSACAVVFGLVLAAAPSTPGDVEWLRATLSIGPALTAATAVTTDFEGNVYMAGLVGGALPGQVLTGPTDAFVRKYNHQGGEIWTRQFGAAFLPGNQALGIGVDVSGVYIVGVTAGELPGQVAAGGSDAFVRKYDLGGNELWTRQFGTMGIDQAQAVVIDPAGVSVVGVTGGALPGQTSAGAADAFVRRYDTDGTELWTRQFGTAGADRAMGVAADATGVYVVGVIGAGGSDAYVRKYDASGVEVWTRQFGGLPFGTDQALAVSVDASGVYVAGTVAFSLPGQVSPDTNNAFVRKYDASGGEMWTRQFTTGGDDQALGISVDGSGVFVSGLVGASLPGQISAGQSDAFVRRYDFNGIELWSRQFGTGGPDRAAGVSAGPAGVYVVGSVGGPLAGQVTEGLPDAFVRRYDASTGVEVWTRQFGTVVEQNDFARAVDAHGQVYVAGAFGVTIPFQQTVGGGFVRAYDPEGNHLWTRQISTGAFALLQGAYGVAADDSGVYVVGGIAGSLTGGTSAGGQDAFIRKYDPAGNELWTRQLPPASDSARAVAVDGSGVYVVGTVLFGALPGQATLGQSDAFIRKYTSEGLELWTRQFGSTLADQALGVATSEIGVHVVGVVGASLPGQVSAGNSDAFIRAYDQAGAELWTAQFGTTGADQALAISTDASGAYVVGYLDGFLPQAQLNMSNAFIRKYSLTGVELWARQTNDSGPDQANGVFAGASGVYVVGTGGIRSSPDGLIRKYDFDGIELWSRVIATGAPNENLPVFGVSADETGLYVAGIGANASGPIGAFVASIADFRLVDIDIKPGTHENTFALGSNGRLPVAILSTPSFDATTVDPVTVTLEEASVALKGNGSSIATFEDVNGDGRNDLVVHVLSMALQLSATDTEAELRGQTFAGEPIRGSDTVRVIP